MKSTDLFQFIHGLWSDKTFGISSPLVPLHHLRKEVDEVIAAPADITEYADCYLLLMDAARLAGFSMTDIENAAEAKYLTNLTRQWGEPDTNGVREHIRE